MFQEYIKNNDAINERTLSLVLSVTPSLDTMMMFEKYPGNGRLPASLFNVIPQFGEGLKKLSLRGCGRLSKVCLGSIGRLCKKLEWIGEDELQMNDTRYKVSLLLFLCLSRAL